MKHSYSSLAAHRRCPKFYYHKYVARDLPAEVPSPQLVRGREVHGILEAAVQTGTMPQSVWTPPGLIQSLHNAGAKTELGLGADVRFDACDVRSRECYLGGYIDVDASDSTRTDLIDWKTGKSAADPFQADVYFVLKAAPLRFYMHFIYVDQRRAAPPLRVDRSAIVRVRDAIDRAEAEADFLPRRNIGCRWCPVPSCKFKEG